MVSVIRYCARNHEDHKVFFLSSQHRNPARCPHQNRSIPITATTATPSAVFGWNIAPPAVTGGGVVVTLGTVAVGSVALAVVGAGVVGVVGMGAGVSVGTTMDVGSTRLPVSVGTA